MRNVQYGSTTISYNVLEQEELSAHYISVDKTSGVILKGKPLPELKADKMILKKAKWILDKLKVVGEVKEDEIVTGSRIQYLGKSYYVEVLFDETIKGATIAFNHSKFIIKLKDKNIGQVDIKKELELFYKIKSVEKITARVNKLSASTQLNYKSLRFIKMDKRWGSCSATDGIVLNTAAVKLPYTLIDYLIVHELSHTKIKDHSKAFYAELSKHLVNWKALDEKMKDMKF